MSYTFDLFQNPDRDVVPIPGARYVQEFVSTDEERKLISQIDAGAWTHEFARRRQHYGMSYLKTSTIAIPPMPPWIIAIAQRIVEAGLFSKMPTQALVNEYLPGQGISAHKDYPPFDEVASLSLMSGCLMEFAKPPSKATETLWLEPRSLIVLTGEARHEWTHAIRPRLNDWMNGEKIPRQRRLSLTLRTV